MKWHPELTRTAKGVVDGLARHVVTAASGGGLVATTALPNAVPGVQAIDYMAGPIVLGLPLGTWVSLGVFCAGAISSVIAKFPDKATEPDLRAALAELQRMRALVEEFGGSRPGAVAAIEATEEWGPR